MRTPALQVLLSLHKGTKLQPPRNYSSTSTLQPSTPFPDKVMVSSFHLCLCWLIFHLANSQPAPNNCTWNVQLQLELLRPTVELAKRLQTHVAYVQAVRKAINFHNEFMPGHPVGNVSQQCEDDMAQYSSDLMKGETYAFLMFDACGKPASDVLEGNTKWLGSYSECTKITRERFNITLDTQYYLVSLIHGKGPSITYGVCVPSSCSSSDINQTSYNDIFYRYLLDQGLLTDISVQSIEREPIQATTIAAICICSFFAVLSLAATIYDVLIHQPRVAAAKEITERHAIDVDDGDNVTQPNTAEMLPTELAPLVDDIVEKHGKDDSTEETGMVGQLLLCFSLYTNIAKLLSTKQAPGSIPCLHGIRFLSMTWVILGHTHVLVFLSIDNTAARSDAEGDFLGQVVANGFVAVDSFFFLSGLLMCYVLLQQMQKSTENGKRVPFWMMYLHRYLRLTPTYLFALMLWRWVYPYLVSGPLSPSPLPDPYIYCVANWWTNILYINNLVNPDEMCMGWSWYLSIDMQFFVVGVPLVYILFRWRLRGLAPMVILLLASFIATGIIALHDGQAKDTTALKSYCRIGPYLVGMTVGWFLLNTKGKIDKSTTMKLLAAVCWAVAAASALAVVYGLYSTHHGTVLTSSVNALYQTVHRTVWGMAVGWVVIACYHGFGGVVDTILSWGFFVPLSRLTYCAYLVHMMVVIFYYITRETLVHYTTLTMIYIFMGNLVTSYGLAFLIFLSVEAPLLELEKLIFKR